MDFDNFVYMQMVQKRSTMHNANELKESVIDYDKGNLIKPGDKKAVRIVIGCTSANVLGNGHETGLWLEECSAPFYVFRDAGFDVKIASIGGGVVTVDKGSVLFKDSFADKRFGDDGNMELLKTTEVLGEIDVGEYDAIFLAGMILFGFCGFWVFWEIVM